MTNRKRPSTLPNDPRLVAIRILMDSDLPKTTLDQVLDKHAESLDTLSRRDRGLANTIIHGTLRRRGQIDRVITSCSERPLAKIKPEVLTALRVGLFQIMFLERIPVSAAVNTAVNAVKRLANKGAAGFANAVLRKASTRHAQIPLPDPDTHPEDYASAICSLPLWLSKRWVTRYGLDKTLTLGRIITTVPPLSIRVNTLKTDRQSLAEALESQADSVVLTHMSPDGISLTGLRSPIHETREFQLGHFQVQDEAAQVVSLLVNPLPGERILDACAGLGGKTGHLAQQMKNQGTVVAADLIPQKLVRLEKEMARLGITNVVPLKLDLLDREALQTIPPFDRVLLDAPCSGLGVLRRNPDTKWNRNPGDIKRLASQQQHLLQNAAALVKPGGTLVFSVCSCEPEENERVVRAFLESATGFYLDPSFPEDFPKENASRFFENGIFKTYPEADAMDGFFAAIFKRRIR